LPALIRGVAEPQAAEVSVLQAFIGFVCIRFSTPLSCDYPASIRALRIARAQPLQGEAGDFAGIFQIEFVFDVRPVGFHCFRAEMEQLRDLTDFVAFADQFQNFKFTIAKSRDGVGFTSSVVMCEFCDHLRRHGWTKIG
jgi:hypothetical protein